MGIFDKLLGSSQGSTNAANSYLDQIPGVAKQYNQPYIDELSDPSAYLNKIMQSYKPSAGYQFKEDRLKRNAANEAAAGGFRGTGIDTDNQSELINALLSGDMQQYLQNYMGAHDKGYAASSNLGDTIGSNLATQAELGFRGAESDRDSKIALLKQLLETGGNAAGAAFGAPGTGSALSGLFGGGGKGSGGAGFGGSNYASPLNRSRSNVPGNAWSRSGLGAY